MSVFSHRATILVGFMMMALILVITGCGGDDDGDANTTISGQVILPPNATNQGGGGGASVSVANTQFVVNDLEKPIAAGGFQTIGTGTTDSTGKYVITTSQTSSAAVIANGTQPSGPQTGKVVPISGLVNLNQDDVTKNFDGTTTIACFAGVRAISQGRITPQQLDAQRISNFERAAANFVAQTNFLDGNSINASADQVRQITNEGAQ